MAPLELYEKIYVKPDFLKTEHGSIPCQDCHGGDPNDPDWQTAHKGIIPDPTLKDAKGVCGECHEEITASAANSLHFTLAPMKGAIKMRVGAMGADKWPQVDQAFERHCGQCHTSCGQCHVSRPDYVQGGFLSAHQFVKRPSMDTTCASCHGGRIHAEFTGGRDDQDADTHYDDQEMECMDCHKGEAMHADATGLRTRFESPHRPRCEQCHEETLSGPNVSESHKQHKDKVACQVCHSQAIQNCFACHVGTDKEGLPYYKCEDSEILFKIGHNPNPTKDRPEKYVVLRHPPTSPGLFDHYFKDAMPEFDNLPTWKMDTPHNIQRITEQNKACNNCHGQDKLFLMEKDVAEPERKANAKVIVKKAEIPQPIE